MTHTSAPLQELLSLSQRAVPETTRTFYRDFLPRQEPITIVGHILSGKISVRVSDRFATTGRFGATPIHAIIYRTTETAGPKLIDALSAFLVRDRLVKIKKRLLLAGSPTRRVDTGLSFCKGVLALIENTYPEELVFVTEHLYPFATAPRRLIASTDPSKRKKIALQKRSP